MRFIFIDAVTGQWVHGDAPLSEWTLTSGLNGQSRLTAAMRHGAAVDVLPWQTEIVAEENGQISWRGFTTKADWDRGGGLSIEAVGVSGYPENMPWRGAQVKEHNIDPTDAWRRVWDQLLWYSQSPRNVTLDDTTTPVRMATDKDEHWQLSRWEASDLGAEVRDLADDTPFEVREDHHWVSDDAHTFLRLGYPTVGRLRDDVRLVEGETIVDATEVYRAGDDFANEVVVLGAGEGRRRIQGHAEVANPDFLRRTYTHEDSTIRTNGRADRVARRVLLVLSSPFEIQEVGVDSCYFNQIGLRLGDQFRVFIRSVDGTTLSQSSTLRTITRDRTPIARLGLAREGAWAYE